MCHKKKLNAVPTGESPRRKKSQKSRSNGNNSLNAVPTGKSPRRKRSQKSRSNRNNLLNVTLDDSSEVSSADCETISGNLCHKKKLNAVPTGESPRRKKSKKSRSNRNNSFNVSSDDSLEVSFADHETISVKLKKAHIKARRKRLKNNPRKKIISTEEESTSCETDSTSSSHSETAETLRSPSKKNKATKEFFKSSDEVKKPKKKRVYNRKHFCVYCKKPVTNFTRHIQEMHSTKKLVKRYMRAAPFSLTRSKISEALKQKGNGKYNCNLVENGEESGYLPERRRAAEGPKSVTYLKDIVRCKYCKKTLHRTPLWLHRRTCKKRPRDHEDVENDPKYRRRVLKEDSIPFIPPNPKRSKEVEELIFRDMQKDEVYVITIKDPLITATADLWLSKTFMPNRYKTVRQNVRDLGHLLLEMQKMDPAIKNLEDCLYPHNFDLIVQATKNLSDYDSISRKVKISSWAKRVKTTVTDALVVMDLNGSTSEDLSNQQFREIRIKTMKKLFKRPWLMKIGALADACNKHDRGGKRKEDPTTEDIKNLRIHLEKEELKLFLALKRCRTPPAYTGLCKVLIATFLVRDRKRANEPTLFFLSHWLKGSKVINNNNEEVLKRLSPDERKSADKYTAYEFPGKNFKSVTVLCTQQNLESIRLLISCRKYLGIETSEPCRDNPLLFARIDSRAPFDGCSVLRKFTSLKILGLKYPEEVTSRGLRHHFATQLFAKNTSDFGVEVGATAMGQTKQTHINHYRMNMRAVQEGVLGNLLDAAGNVSNNDDEGDENGNEEVGMDDAGASCPIDNEDLPIHIGINEDIDAASSGVGNHRDIDSTKSTDESDTNPPPEVGKKGRKRWTYAEQEAVLKNAGTLKIKDILKKEEVLRGSRSYAQIAAYLSNVRLGKITIPDGLKKYLKEL